MGGLGVLRGLCSKGLGLGSGGLGSKGLGLGSGGVLGVWVL